MNTNFVHNIINVLIVLIPAFETIDWTPFLSDSAALKLVAGLGVVKIAINAWRDGPTGLVLPQPPVVRK